MQIEIQQHYWKKKINQLGQIFNQLPVMTLQVIEKEALQNKRGRSQKRIGEIGGRFRQIVYMMGMRCIG